MKGQIRNAIATLVLLLEMIRHGSGFSLLCKVAVKKSIRKAESTLQSRLQSSSLQSDAPTDVQYPNFDFTIFNQDTNSKARTGLISTPHGAIETPNFVFCATKAAMKSMTTKQIREEGSQFILSNTFHLMITPGADIIEKLGGLQKITGWNGPMLTDSGGYQIFSMGHGSVAEEIKGRRNSEGLGLNKTLLKIDEDGAVFRSYLDGSILKLTPERSIEIQQKLGADLIVVLDECTPFHVDKRYTEDSMHRSHRWGDRCLTRFANTNAGKQALYGIVQGGIYEDLRIQSCEYVNTRPFFGIAIGGSLGASKKEMHEIVAFTRSYLRNDRPIHLLGIGGLRDIFHGVRQGIDSFDCVHPTRLGRHGGALVKASYWGESAPLELATDSNSYLNAIITKLEKLRGKVLPQLQDIEERIKRLETINLEASSKEREQMIERLNTKKRSLLARLSSKEGQLRNQERKISEAGTKKTVREHIHLEKSSFRVDSRPIDENCNCYTCKNFSRGYLHHLFRAKEMLGSTLVSLHNVHFMNEMMRRIREGIRTATLDDVETEYIHADLISSVQQSRTVGE